MLPTWLSLVKKYWINMWKSVRINDLLEAFLLRILKKKKNIKTQNAKIIWRNYYQNQVCTLFGDKKLILNSFILVSKFQFQFELNDLNCRTYIKDQRKTYCVLEDDEESHIKIVSNKEKIHLKCISVLFPIEISRSFPFQHEFFIKSLCVNC